LAASLPAESEQGMHTNILEETELTKQGSGQEQQSEPPEPEEVQPETQEQEVTALVTTEPEVIEGEVIEIEQPDLSADHLPPKQKPYWLLIPATIVLCLIFLAASILLPLFTPTATITVIPVEHSITISTAIRVHGRLLPALTLSQSATAPATGIRHLSATKAHGTITLYNGQFRRQTIAAGTIFTGASGVRIITDQAARIPAGNPPIYGQTSVPAHALSAGASGNIHAYDINTACCLTSVLAKNTRAFTGGEEARVYVVVTHADIASAAATIQTTLAKSELAALAAQITTGESLTPPLCFENVTSDHRIGDEAKQVRVTVSETCRGFAYASHDVYQDAAQLLPSQASSTLGANYSIIGAIHVSIIRATISDKARGIATLAMQADAISVYQITPTIQRHLLHLTAGKTNQQAVSLLLSQPGIQGVQVALGGWNRILPQDPGSITIVVMYRSASL
jgi:hypothetical protein